MGCACKGASKEKFLWYDTVESEFEPTVYRTEVEAKAKVMRRGGRYIRYDGKSTIGAAIAQAEADRAARLAAASG